MEILFVAQHRNQYYSRVKPQRPAKFGNAPSKHFRDINCRTFHSGPGLLPAPFQTSSTPFTKSTTHAPPASHPPKTPPPASKSHSNSHSVDNGRFKTALKSSSITINVKIPRKETSFNEICFVNENLLFSELWAGPAYSNSPPPSSLPIPKFSMRPPNRTVSLDSPVSDYADFDVKPTVKSAPASPSREHTPCMRDMFLSADSATKTLCRILNLDVNNIRMLHRETWSSVLVARQAGKVHDFIAKMGQVVCSMDYVKRMKADSNTFGKQKGTSNEVEVQGAACPGKFQVADAIVGYALDSLSPESTSYHDPSIFGFYLSFVPGVLSSSRVVYW
ncbi:hypothetical protein SADUNF_Sadunf05G0156000 [Salix dunnii]|uniref:Uncharacterized protein n=1 Tax=Salix dunnii TaxID=1413687 RepID=A0A835K8L8_9ROSI|nr:hypothetical protein SADUNF_Sadunf05G0156000 [Salix dunnii]